MKALIFGIKRALSLNLGELADKVGVTQTTMCRWYHPKNPSIPSSMAWRRLAEISGMSPVKLDKFLSAQISESQVVNAIETRRNKSQNPHFFQIDNLSIDKRVRDRVSNSPDLTGVGKFTSVHHISILGRLPMSCSENVDGIAIGRVAIYFDAPEGCYAVEMDGGSFEPGIKRGDILIFDPGREVGYGDIADNKSGDYQTMVFSHKSVEVIAVLIKYQSPANDPPKMGM